jgi:hypothetical protein
LEYGSKAGVKEIKEETREDQKGEELTGQLQVSHLYLSLEDG